MEKQTPVKKVVVIDHFGTAREISGSDILHIKTRASVAEYCGTFDVVLKNDEGKNSEAAEPKDEMELWAGYPKTGIEKIMAGYVDRIILKKEAESGETVEILGRSYESFLFDTEVTGRIEYSEGLSQVVREVLKGTPFNPKGILDSKGTGVVMFRNIPAIDLIRQVSEENGWVFRIDYDKTAHFEPFTPSSPTHTLTTKDVKGFKIVKGS
jgi:hypothetical protein